VVDKKLQASNITGVVLNVVFISLKSGKTAPKIPERITCGGINFHFCGLPIAFVLYVDKGIEFLPFTSYSNLTQKLTKCGCCCYQNGIL